MPERGVLVVDDESDIRDSLQSYLDSVLPDVRVATASDAESALELLRRESFDVVVSDFKMPGMNGLDFLAKVRDGWPRVRRILITAFATPDTEARARADGDQFVRKPLELERFRKTLALALDA